MPPLFISAHDKEEQIEQLERNIAKVPASNMVWREQMRAMQAELRAQPSAQDIISELESLVGTLPLSLHAWYELVGGVNFVGDHPSWRALLPESPLDYPSSEYEYLNPMWVLDPLFVQPLDERVLARFRSWAQENASGKTRYPFNLAPGDWMRYLDNTGNGGPNAVQVTLPAAEADVGCVFPGHQTPFVAYLRNSFAWGGFPGWATLDKRPEADLAFLTEALLPL